MLLTSILLFNTYVGRSERFLLIPTLLVLFSTFLYEYV